ncbi:MAG: NAD(P)-dependent oxidoreductase [Candidatus Calescibacterium sp.]|nr:hydroxyacid dehydrogenase [Candidatus Calescibacterium sp.]MCX7972415.1 hydroxyacid dehydrogenase [bacterium]MDW8195694.1 NAD(P)-dependent oxidoreductase [Candidatus Calescibacterium sp.]
MITITYQPKDKERKILLELEEYGKVVFYQEIRENKEDILKNTEILVTFFPDKELSKHELELLSRSDKLKIVQSILSGIDHIDSSWFPRAKIIGNTGAYSEIMVEHIFAFILFWAKNLMENHLKLKNGIYEQKANSLLIKGKTIGIVGFGGIGKEVARIAKAFYMKVLAINTTGKTDSKYVDEIYTLEGLDYVLLNSDIVVLSLPLSKSTENLINYDKLRLMKRNAILINVGRGQIINQKDLYYFLRDNPDFRCALDVWWSEPAFNQEFKLNYPFFELPNFLGSPHNSALVPETFEIRTRHLVEKLKKILSETTERRRDNV